MNNYYDLNYQISKHESTMVVKSYLPQRYTIFHVHSHQYIKAETNKLSLPQKFNELADDVVKKFTRTTLNIHIPFVPIAI